MNKGKTGALIKVFALTILNMPFMLFMIYAMAAKAMFNGYTLTGQTSIDYLFLGMLFLVLMTWSAFKWHDYTDSQIFMSKLTKLLKRRINARPTT